MSVDGAAPEAQRIDRWLWCARFFKTRSLASKFINDSNMRVSRGEITMRAEKPSFMIRPGDTLVFSKGDHLKIIEVAECALRRGPASEAQMLYKDHSPPRPPKIERKRAPFEREKGAGRPTKKERRSLEALKTP